MRGAAADLLMSGIQCSISWCRVYKRGASCLGVLCTPHTCTPHKKDAVNSQDLGIVFCGVLVPISTGSFEEGFPMPFNM